MLALGFPHMFRALITARDPHHPSPRPRAESLKLQHPLASLFPLVGVQALPPGRMMVDAAS